MFADETPQMFTELILRFSAKSSAHIGEKPERKPPLSHIGRLGNRRNGSRNETSQTGVRNEDAKKRTPFVFNPKPSRWFWTKKPTRMRFSTFTTFVLGAGAALTLACTKTTPDPASQQRATGKAKFEG
jgi:hypothetical protein